MNVMICGAGTIGSVLARELSKKNITIKYIVRTSGIFENSKKIAEQKDWRTYAHEVDCAFICIPTLGKGEQAFEYELAFLEKGKPIITCEKASVAYYWHELKNYKNIFKYTASVGGGTKMLKEISNYNPHEITEIKAVVNGTLNYISTHIKAGKSHDEIVKETLEKGYAEPGASHFEEIIKGEMNDVILKTIIIANHSEMFNKTITKENIEIVDVNLSKRCIVKINKDTIQAGFIEDTTAHWLPDGVNNVLYINEEKKAYGPGAGAEATVSSMMEDFKDVQSTF